MCAMYNKFLNSNPSSKVKKENNSTLDEDSSDRSDLLDIWRVNPSYRDIDVKTFIIKGSVSIILLLAISMLLYFLTTNIYLTVSLLFPLLFVYFFDQGKRFLNKVFNLFNKAFYVNPFGDLEFFTIKEEPLTLLFVNKKVSSTVALRVFKVEVLPENLQPTLNQFLKSLNNSQLSFSYQVSHKPIIDLRTQNHNNLEGLKKIKSQAKDNVPSTISIFFSVYCHKKGILKRRRLNYLLNNVEDYSNELKSEFTANFHHTKIRLLQTKELLEAVRDTTHNIPTDFGSSELKEVPKNSYIFNIFLKSVFSLFLVILISIILFSINFSTLLVLTIDCLFLYYLFFVWWRDVLFFFSNRTLYLYEDIKVVKLFPDTKFFQYKRFPTVIFANIQNKILIGVKLLNLGAAVQPMLAYPDKFFRAINNHKLYFNYFVNATPADERMLSKECFNHYNRKTRDQFTYTTEDISKWDKNDYPSEDYKNWLEMRSGIWKTYLSIAINCYEKIDSNGETSVLDMVYELEEKAVILKKSFEQNYLRLRLEEVWKEQLLNGFVSTALKTRDFSYNNTHLNYIYFQGKNLMNLITISNEFKKGLETRIAAEFNTPLHLKNDLIIGQTINTEFLEEERHLGFTFEQFKNLLITNGNTQERELAKMKIAAELIKTQMPCVIFDYSGDWSKIIRYFENSIYEDKFLHFQLGKTFNVNLSKSGIKHDDKNIEYLNLFYDVFALAYKEQRITLEALKKSIKKEQTFDFNPLLLDYKYNTDYKPFIKENRLLSLIDELTNKTIVVSEKTSEFEDNINPIDFLKNDKSIIIDLSILKDLEHKTFITFVILSKFIHYINNLSDYTEKAIFIPKVDAFFDANYLDNNHNAVNFGKIEKFLEPLCRCGFGLIFSANQVSYLHQNFLNYFPNILSFRATNSRDIAVLKNQMNLQELQGSGYYSSKRNNTYQIDYLKNLRGNEVIVKRADIYQPFPGIITYEPFSKTLPLTYDKIVKYMERQGYNLKRSERRILDQAKKTIFEKDFGLHSYFLEDIMNFLKNIKTLDKVGQLYKGKLKEELLKLINPTAKKRNYANRVIKELRDELFELLIRHNYLVESHPNRASGSESMRSSFAVGPQYEKALQDYYESQKSSVISYEPIDVESDNSDNFDSINNSVNSDNYESSSRARKINAKNLKKAFTEHFGSMFIYEHFKMYQAIKDGNFKRSLKIGKNLLKRFLRATYNTYYSVNNAIKSADIDRFIESILEVESFPFTGDDLLQFFNSCKNIEVNDSVKIAETCKNIYEMYSTILDGFKQFLYLEEN